MTSAPDFGRPGSWASLWPKALALMAHLESQTADPCWTFGGGTVLMLRINHRLSRDIDLFVPDPQYLGYVNPRLSDAAEAVSTDYEEAASFLKFFLAEGEIDVVVGEALTQAPFETVEHAGRTVRVETCAEIVAKKMWHRGHHARGRDLFDLCAVALAEPAAIEIALPFMRRHGAAFLDLLETRATVVRAEFEAVDAIGARPDYEACRDLARDIVGRALRLPG